MQVFTDAGAGIPAEPANTPTGQVTADIKLDTQVGTELESTPVRTAVPPRHDDVWKTPMFEQYWGIRETLADNAILFYRMGDFFEIFGADAVTAAPLLEIQLTARHKDAPMPVPMCGVPVHAVDSYAEKILAHGFKIAICEQVSDPAALKTVKSGKPKLVERAVTRILTPGLPTDFSRIDSKAPHWFLSVGMTGESLG